jgi:hypothetical protein
LVGVFSASESHCRAAAWVVATSLAKPPGGRLIYRRVSDTNGAAIMFTLFYRIFAGIGAALILGALTFVSLLIGGLINGMVVLLSGPLIDKMIEKRKRKTATA